MTTALTDTSVDTVVPPAADDVVVPPADAVVPPAEGETPPPVDIDTMEFAVPEGFDATQLNAAEIKAFAKELGLDAAAAQKVADRVIKQRTDFDAAQVQTQADVVAGWAQEARDDKEIGGDKFDATVAAARSVIENANLVAPAFKDFLEQTGLGNHPEMIRVFSRLAPHFKNDTPVNGNGGAPQPKAFSMYDNPTSQHS